MSDMGKLMDIERVIEVFFEKYPTLRLPQAWIRELEEKCGVSHDDILNASKRVRRRMRIQKCASVSEKKDDRKEEHLDAL